VVRNIVRYVDDSISITIPILCRAEDGICKARLQAVKSYRLRKCDWTAGNHNAMKSFTRVYDVDGQYLTVDGICSDPLSIELSLAVHGVTCARKGKGGYWSSNANDPIAGLSRERPGTEAQYKDSAEGQFASIPHANLPFSGDLPRSSGISFLG
jgi:hypothetical protein